VIFESLNIFPAANNLRIGWDTALQIN